MLIFALDDARNTIVKTVFIPFFLWFLVLPLAQAFPDKTCGWIQPDNNLTWVNKTVKNTIDFGTVYIPRDAPIGSFIGIPHKVGRYTGGDAQYHLYCSRYAGISMTSRTKSAPNVTVPAGLNAKTDVIYTTSVAGVGVMFKMEALHSFNWQQSYPFFPGYIVVPGGKTFAWEKKMPQLYATLIKTGEIKMGESSLNAAGYAWGDGSVNLFDVDVSATVVRSECVIPQAAKSIEVKMGYVKRINFKGENSTLDNKPFEIPLTQCVYGNYPTGQPTNYFSGSFANLRLDGVKGSKAVNAAKGILGLTSDSEAKGIAVQILRKDGVTPMPLGVDTRIRRLQDGNMMLELNARYIQTSKDPKGPEPGSANASANFTLTYK